MILHGAPYFVKCGALFYIHLKRKCSEKSLFLRTVDKIEKVSYI